MIESITQVSKKNFTKDMVILEVFNKRQKVDTFKQNLLTKVIMKLSQF